LICHDRPAAWPGGVARPRPLSTTRLVLY
jgi:hypothetical protein